MGDDQNYEYECHLFDQTKFIDLHLFLYRENFPMSKSRFDFTIFN